MCVCVLDFTASSRVVLSSSLFPFFHTFFVLAFVLHSPPSFSLFSADELELLTEGLDLLGVDPTGYDDEDD